MMQQETLEVSKYRIGQALEVWGSSRLGADDAMGDRQVSYPLASEDGHLQSFGSRIDADPVHDRAAVLGEMELDPVTEQTV